MYKKYEIINGQYLAYWPDGSLKAMAKTPLSLLNILKAYQDHFEKNAILSVEEL